MIETLTDMYLGGCLALFILVHIISIRYPEEVGNKQYTHAILAVFIWPIALSIALFLKEKK